MKSKMFCAINVLLFSTLEKNDSGGEMTVVWLQYIGEQGLGMAGQRGDTTQSKSRRYDVEINHMCIGQIATVQRQRKCDTEHRVIIFLM
jgi:hypothetical protein